MSRNYAADERERETGMRQSMGAMIAKIAFGVLFVVTGITTNWAEKGESDPLATALISVVFGLALIAWGFLPWLQAKKKREAAAAKEEAARKEAEYIRMNAPKLCPACGAATKGERCEYCGTPLK